MTTESPVALPVTARGCELLDASGALCLTCRSYEAAGWLMATINHADHLLEIRKKVLPDHKSNSKKQK